MIIDGHAHACGEYLTIESIKQKIKNNKLDYVVLVPGELNSKKTYHFKNYTSKNPYKDVIVKTNRMTKFIISITRLKRVLARGNEYVYTLKTKLPDHIKQFFWLTKNQWPTINERFDRMKFDGLKLHQCWEKFSVNSQWFIEVMDWIKSNDIPVFLHLYSHKEIMSLINYIKRNRKVKIIIGHNFGLEYFINEEKKYFDNIFFDLSNSYFVSTERIMLALKYFGSTKLLLGSDTPYGKNSLEKSINQIYNLKITANEKCNILGINMKNLLKV